MVDDKIREPKFNAAIEWAKMLLDLKRAYHEFMLQENSHNAISILKSWTGEIYPRMTSKQQERVKRLEQKTINMNKPISYPTLIQPKHAPRFEPIQTWFRELNTITDELGLLMPDKDHEGEGMV